MNDRVVRMTAGAALAVLAVGSLASCSKTADAPVTAGAGSTGTSVATSPGTSAATSGTGTTAVSGAAASDAEVAAGLKKMQVSAAAVAAAGADATKAKAAVAELEPAWEPVEDVVRAKDPDLYLEIEDALDTLKDSAGDPAKAAKGAAAMATATGAYLAKHPG